MVHIRQKPRLVKNADGSYRLSYEPTLLSKVFNFVCEIACGLGVILLVAAGMG